MNSQGKLRCMLLAIMLLCGMSMTYAQETSEKMSNKKETAGRDAFGDFAPKFAEMNDDILFGEIWSREKELSPRDRSLITVAALFGAGILDYSFQGHLQKAKENGVTKEEITEVITQLAFYSGWPKAWAALYMAKDIYGDEQAENETK